ncbi:diacylglycerol kinase [Comamonas testosteroni]|uniref:diacylglycerol kinase n=1 Tax=Comamonas testosteroni TaxID=285 RepID=UPI002E14862C|nr:diacylglycerol kinase [Comamonas testosteroni]
MKDEKHIIETEPFSSFENEQKSRQGILRIWHASHYSIQGLRAGWNEPAFRLESVFSFVLVPLAFWLGQGWVEVALLSGSILILMIVELLNTAVESAIDRIGPQWHELSKRAKDMGSAAVLLATLLTGGVWLSALWQRLIN